MKKTIFDIKNKKRIVTIEDEFEDIDFLLADAIVLEQTIQNIELNILNKQEKLIQLNKELTELKQLIKTNKKEIKDKTTLQRILKEDNNVIK